MTHTLTQSRGPGRKRRYSLKEVSIPIEVIVRCTFRIKPENLRSGYEGLRRTERSQGTFTERERVVTGKSVRRGIGLYKKRVN